MKARRPWPARGFFGFPDPEEFAAPSAGPASFALGVSDAAEVTGSVGADDGGALPGAVVGPPVGPCSPVAAPPSTSAVFSLLRRTPHSRRSLAIVIACSAISS